MNLIDIKHATKTPVITCNGKIINPEDFPDGLGNCGGQIKLVHLLTRPDDEREQKSIESLKPLSQWFDYVQVKNELYDGQVPKF